MREREAEGKRKGGRERCLKLKIMHNNMHMYCIYTSVLQCYMQLKRKALKLVALLCL